MPHPEGFGKKEGFTKKHLQDRRGKPVSRRGFDLNYMFDITRLICYKTAASLAIIIF
jgi:hypothetical protein